MFTPKTLSDPMPGTSGAPFTVISAQAVGRIGFRDLGNGTFRVRVEPTLPGDYLAFPSNWTRPEGSQPRYSAVVSGGTALASAIALASAVLNGGDVSPVVPPKPKFSASIESYDETIDLEEDGDGDLVISDSFTLDRGSVVALRDQLNAFLAS